MQKYYLVKISNYNYLESARDLGFVAMTEFGSTGIEEFSLDEQRVDELLGDRSYSGADLPTSVIDEVAQTVQEEQNAYKLIYFNSLLEATNFQTYLNENDIDSNIEEKDVQDWNEQWKKSYAPITISRELEIVPAWYKDNYASEALSQIYIYPGMGFGTGNHETTFLCLKLLFDTNFNFEGVKCMDFGCGSGILGLALRILQKKSIIDLYDIDQDALDNCKQNVELNQINENNLRYLLPSNKRSFLKKYDVVFANILKNVLELEADQILSLVDKGGSLIVSGLLNGQQDEIIKLYTDNNKSLIYKKELIKGDWVAVLFERAR